MRDNMNVFKHMRYTSKNIPNKALPFSEYIRQKKSEKKLKDEPNQ